MVNPQPLGSPWDTYASLTQANIDAEPEPKKRKLSFAHIHPRPVVASNDETTTYYELPEDDAKSDASSDEGIVRRPVGQYAYNLEFDDSDSDSDSEELIDEGVGG
jgi:hypothetical protein